MIKLSKGSTIKLAKNDGESLTKIRVGMGWQIKTAHDVTETKEVEVADKTVGNFFRKIFGGVPTTHTETQTITRRVKPKSNDEYDLDASCVVLGSNGSPLSRNSLVYFNHKDAAGIHHGGDNLTGSDGKHDDETIDIELPEVDKRAAKIVVFMNIYCASRRNQSFEDLTSAYIRIVNSVTGDELCQYDLTDGDALDRNATGLILGELVRDDSGWSFTAIGKCIRADYPSDVIDKI